MAVFKVAKRGKVRHAVRRSFRQQLRGFLVAAELRLFPGHDFRWRTARDGDGPGLHGLGQLADEIHGQ